MYSRTHPVSLQTNNKQEVQRAHRKAHMTKLLEALRTHSEVTWLSPFKQVASVLAGHENYEGLSKADRLIVFEGN